MTQRIEFDPITNTMTEYFSWYEWDETLRKNVNHLSSWQYQWRDPDEYGDNRRATVSGM